MRNFVYLVGAPDAEEVAVIDPAWDVAAIEAAALSDGKKLACVVLSHSHHDHLNGLPELLRSHDLPVYAQREEVAFSDALREWAGAVRSASPGDEVRVGPLELSLVHTPGHTPGSQCIFTRGALLSGDTVFVNACGRCDRRGGDPAQLYRSLYEVLGRLPDETRLYPGHDYGDVGCSSLGRERERNPYFRLPDLQSFVAFRNRPRG